MNTNDDSPDTQNTSGPDHVREDRQYLEPLSFQDGGIVIGWQDEIHGPDSRPIASFQPTIFELKQLARYWYRERWEVDFEWIYLQQTGSREIRIGPYADRRLGRIRAAIGGRAFQEVADAVDAEVRMEIGDEDWTAITGVDRTSSQRLDERISSELAACHSHDTSDLCGADFEEIVKQVWPWITEAYNGSAHRNVYSVIYGGHIPVAPKDAARIRELATALRLKKSHAEALRPSGESS